MWYQLLVLTAPAKGMHQRFKMYEAYAKDKVWLP
jgi:hypothetical protein